MITENWTLTKGKYKNKTLKEVYNLDPWYIDYLYRSSISWRVVNHELRFAIEDLIYN